VLILASRSAIRRKILEDAGVEFEVMSADIDEEAAKDGDDYFEAIATRLAEAKARAVSALRPGDWVIGSDSIISVEGRIFNKPRDRDEAAEHLRFFSGNTMLLVSAVALAHGGEVDWSRPGRAQLEVRELSEAFIQAYLDAEWPEVGNTVGVFRMEGRGAQLFDAIAGGHYTILGMPLLPLLKQLRKRDLLQS
jgi:septum formation protein